MEFSYIGFNYFPVKSYKSVTLFLHIADLSVDASCQSLFLLFKNVVKLIFQTFQPLFFRIRAFVNEVLIVVDMVFYPVDITSELAEYRCPAMGILSVSVGLKVTVI